MRFLQTFKKRLSDDKNAPIKKHPFQCLFCFLLLILGYYNVLFSVSGLVWIYILCWPRMKKQIKQQRKKLKINITQLAFRYIFVGVFLSIFALILFVSCLLFLIFLLSYLYPNPPPEFFKWFNVSFTLIFLLFMVLVSVWIHKKFGLF